MTLFDLGFDGASDIYRRMRQPEREDDRAMLDAMYDRARPYLDANFKDQFARATNDRFFELRLVTALVDEGFVLEGAQEGRPDIATRLTDGRRLWIEAVSLSWGAPTNPDAPPPLHEGFQPAPIKSALMRHTNALREKRNKFRLYRRNGVVKDEDCCVVAMSSGGLHPHVEGVSLPRVVSAVLPFGDEVVTLNKGTLEVVAIHNEHRPEVLKANGSPIPMTAFLDPKEYGQISAILHDTAFISTWPGGLQPNRWVTVHNPTANVPLPPEMFPWGKRFQTITRGRQRFVVEHPSGAIAGELRLPDPPAGLGMIGATLAALFARVFSALRRFIWRRRHR
jgi:hypothetical protein